MISAKIDLLHTAIVMVDLQRGYCDPGSDAAAKLGWDVEDCDAVCRYHVPYLDAIRTLLPSEHIIWIKMEEDYQTFAENSPHKADHLHNTFTPLVKRGTPGHEFHIVQPEPGEPVFLKFHMSAFHTPAFKNYLEKRGITTLIFSGVLTSRCVAGTVIVASTEGYNCVLVEDLVGVPTHLKDEAAKHIDVIRLFYAKLMGWEVIIKYVGNIASGGPKKSSSDKAA